MCADSTSSGSVPSFPSRAQLLSSFALLLFVSTHLLCRCLLLLFHRPRCSHIKAPAILQLHALSSPAVLVCELTGWWDRMREGRLSEKRANKRARRAGGEGQQAGRSKAPQNGKPGTRRKQAETPLKCRLGMRQASKPTAQRSMQVAHRNILLGVESGCCWCVRDFSWYLLIVPV